jgi:hypothetical protein
VFLELVQAPLQRLPQPVRVRLEIQVQEQVRHWATLQLALIRVLKVHQRMLVPRLEFALLVQPQTMMTRLEGLTVDR